MLEERYLRAGYEKELKLNEFRVSIRDLEKLREKTEMLIKFEGELEIKPYYLGFK